MSTTTKNAKVMWAEDLWEKLHKGFLDMEQTLMTIIASEAWKPVGYNTFAEAWTAKMSDITLASEIRPHVVYAMLDEGATVEEIADTIKGVGPEQAENLKRQKNNGVRAKDASTIVRKHRRRLPQRHFVTIEVDADTRRAWGRIAKAHNTTVEDIALPAVQAAFEALA